ncbi:MAG TPA: hypothetical protein VJY15_22565 [Candidatus Acidoferrum sp.]|nr:hypothetical protein [Candidatus Acidoferrum sp.]
MAANENMINSNRHSPSVLLVPGRIFMMGGAGLLILVGLVLQLGALGYGHAQPGNLWIASTIVERVWSMLITLLDSPGMQELLTFWPLLLVSMGLAILLVTKGEESQRALSSSRGGQNHGQ